MISYLEQLKQILLLLYCMKSTHLAKHSAPISPGYLDYSDPLLLQQVAACYQ